MAPTHVAKQKTDDVSTKNHAYVMVLTFLHSLHPASQSSRLVVQGVNQLPGKAGEMPHYAYGWIHLRILMPA